MTERDLPAWARILPDGVELRVRVVPRASRSRIAGVLDGRLKVQVAAAPVDGAANEALAEVLAKASGVAKRDVGVESGAASRSKTVRIAADDPGLVVDRLVEHAATGSR